MKIYYKNDDILNTFFFRQDKETINYIFFYYTIKQTFNSRNAQYKNYKDIMEII
jgi:hypothetical protein